MKKQLFFSHDWRIDSQGRNNHERVRTIVKKIQKYGLTTWFDEEDMNGNIDAAMADGIENSDAVIVCITETYCNKINNASRDSRIRDNCLKEWTYAQARNKLLIPLIMEPNMLNTSQWPPGVVSMYLASTLYISAIHDDDNMTIIALIKMLELNGIRRNSLPPIKLDKSKKIDYSDNFNNFNKSSISPFILDKKDLDLEETSPLSPTKTLRQYIPNIIRSKTTNFTFTRLPPINLTPLNIRPNPRTRIRAKSEVLRSKHFNLNCAYLPRNNYFNYCVPRKVPV